MYFGMTHRRCGTAMAVDMCFNNTTISSFVDHCFLILEILGCPGERPVIDEAAAKLQFHGRLDPILLRLYTVFCFPAQLLQSVLRRIFSRKSGSDERLSRVSQIFSAAEKARGCRTSCIAIGSSAGFSQTSHALFKKFPCSTQRKFATCERLLVCLLCR